MQNCHRKTIIKISLAEGWPQKETVFSPLTCLYTHTDVYTSVLLMRRCRHTDRSWAQGSQYLALSSGTSLKHFDPRNTSLQAFSFQMKMMLSINAERENTNLLILGNLSNI